VSSIGLARATHIQCGEAHYPSWINPDEEMPQEEQAQARKEVAAIL